MTTDTVGGDAIGTSSRSGVPAGSRRAIAPRVAEAFQHTYAWAVALMALALLPALLLPRHMPEPVVAPTDPANRVPDPA